MDEMEGVAMNIERQRVRDSARLTVVTLLFIILVHWLTHPGHGLFDLFDVWDLVFLAMGLAVGSYVSWPGSKGRRA